MSRFFHNRLDFALTNKEGQDYIVLCYNFLLQLFVVCFFSLALKTYAMQLYDSDFAVTEFCEVLNPE